MRSGCTGAAALPRRATEVDPRMGQVPDLEGLGKAEFWDSGFLPGADGQTPPTCETSCTQFTAELASAPKHRQGRPFNTLLHATRTKHDATMVACMSRPCAVSHRIGLPSCPTTPRTCKHTSTSTVKGCLCFSRHPAGSIANHAVAAAAGHGGERGLPGVGPRRMRGAPRGARAAAAAWRRWQQQLPLPPP